jgi:hypothetical protein
VEAGDRYALENNSLAYYRAADGSPAVRLGVGTAAISPDGKWVLLASNHVSPKLPLQLEPIGPGNAKDLSTPGLIAFDHYAWSDDGRQVVYGGQTDQNQWNVCRPSGGGRGSGSGEDSCPRCVPVQVFARCWGQTHTPDISRDLGQDQFASSRHDCRAVKIN